jgi:hypothetical protein
MDTVLERQHATSQELFRRVDERDALATERHEALMNEHRRLLDRFARSEDRIVAVLSDLNHETARNSSPIDDMTEAIRAGTRAILSMLDRLGTAPR